MSAQPDDSTAHSLEKKTVAGVTFTDTRSGDLDEAAIPNDDFKSHYLYPGDTKTASSFPVVDANGNLCRQNVISAWAYRRYASSVSDLKSKLQKLNDEFEDPPLDFSEESSRVLPDSWEPSEEMRETMLSETAAESDRFERAVEIVDKDESEQIAYGAVLVPDELDHQLDYIRGDTIRELAKNYRERFESGDVYGGVMHAVFPSGVTLAEDRVLDEPETLGSHDFPTDTWIQGYKFEDSELWSLVESGVLGGYSIGGTAKGRITNPIPEGYASPRRLRRVSRMMSIRQNYRVVNSPRAASSKCHQLTTRRWHAPRTRNTSRIPG